MTQDLLSRLKTYYEHFDCQSSEALLALYAEDVTFIDPLHSIEGVDSLCEYFEQMSQGLMGCRFEFVGETYGQQDLWLKWIMHYSHRKLKRGQPLVLQGASHLIVGDKVSFHQDFYDMGAMLYEHLPVLGSGVRWLKQRL
ncbi:MAG: nuclear transport factor 2 family protein [Cellvibrionaceae bacterium]|nr:nuclear transport factor 2 family protein [Cellvibrionaceae bacterium]